MFMMVIALMKRINMEAIGVLYGPCVVLLYCWLTHSYLVISSVFSLCRWCAATMFMMVMALMKRINMEAMMMMVMMMFYMVLVTCYNHGHVSMVDNEICDTAGERTPHFPLATATHYNEVRFLFVSQVNDCVPWFAM